MKLSYALVVAASVFLTDLATKSLIETPRWGWHQFEPERVYALMALTVGWVVILLLVPRLRLGAAILAGCGLGQLWSLWIVGRVANPFVLHNPAVGELTAFNFADVMLLPGMVALFTASVTWFMSRNGRPVS